MTPAREGGPGRGDPGLPPKIVLVGFMAAGKSTVGRLLARRVGYDFVDLDEEIERREGRSIPEIFREGGEEAFREMEAEATRRHDDSAGVVVATGGGWMAREELRGRWPEAATVWLRVSPGEVLERIGPDTGSRPMLDPASPERSIREILDRRRPDYRRADLAVATDARSPEEVADRILERLRGGG